MSYAYKVDGVWHEIEGGFEIGGVQYPENWPLLATEDEREAVGVCEIVEAGPQPVGVQVHGLTIVGADTPSRMWVTEPYTLTSAKAARLASLKEERAARLDDAPFEADASDYVQACYARAAELATAINGAASAEAVTAIDLQAGWPE